MKINDYAPRTGAIESYLTGNNLTGVEVGVDVGSHAESLLTHCDIERLYLIDIWDNPWCEGYCEGRLARWRNKIKMVKGESKNIVKTIKENSLDFVYLDQQHDYNTVFDDLILWWITVKPGGMVALRNYSVETIQKAADTFKHGKSAIVDKYVNELIVFK